MNNTAAQIKVLETRIATLKTELADKRMPGFRSAVREDLKVWKAELKRVRRAA